ncbi:MAG: hypothetical protein P4M13_05150 [Alphaproteobacteria bacterium]|nr:hypothetical protein [Alphaproteobacteria bacterium]
MPHEPIAFPPKIYHNPPAFPVPISFIIMSPNSPFSGVSRFAAFALSLTVFVCVAMIGGAGYMKYQLDRAETVLAAPDNALGGNQDMFDSLRRDWGYGGFVGLAQKYVSTRDASNFADMKELIKSADDIVAHLPDTTSAETHRELTAIAAMFDGALQKIDAPADATGANEFTAADLAPLYATLPVLETRDAAANASARLAAQKGMQFWAMLLTLVSWSSLIIAAACAAGIYLVLRDRQSAPMRALAQSIQNMARGDMRTAIWGIERQDMIGELARAVDLARYQFSHLPDLSLLSEQGPVRMRFEGGSRSLFEAMMKAISGDSETIRAQAATLTDAVALQKQSVAALAQKVETILQNIAKSGQSGDMQIKQAIAEMTGSAENLKNAHAHAADQLTRLIPLIQDRAQGLAEITQITGKQIAQTLQSLATSEIGLKSNAEQAGETLNKLSSTADDLGERLFGAINLLQAGGKVLAETTENIKNNAPEAQFAALAERLNQIKDQLTTLQNGLDEKANTPVGAATQESVLAPLTDQIEHIAGQLDVLQVKLDEQTNAHAYFAEALEKGAAPDAIAAPLKSQLEQIASQLALVQNKLEGQTNIQVGAAPESALVPLASQFEHIAGQLAALQIKLDEQKDAQAGLAGALEQNLAQNHAEQKEAVAASLTALHERIAAFVTALPDQMRSNLQEDLQRITAHNDIADLGAKISELAEVNGKVAILASALPGDLRQNLREELQVLKEQNQLSVLEEKVAELAELNGKVAILASALPGDLRQNLREELQNLSEQNDIAALGEKIAAAQGETNLALSAFGQELAATRQAAEAAQAEAGKPIPMPTCSIPPEMQQQFLDQWFQVSAQIEASRASLVGEIAGQLDKIETRLTAKPTLAPTRSVSDFATQVQLEKQAEILTELVDTLGILDGHLQQIKEELHAANG